jgi:hypothetical protein
LSLLSYIDEYARERSTTTSRDGCFHFSLFLFVFMPGAQKEALELHRRPAATFPLLVSDLTKIMEDSMKELPKHSMFLLQYIRSTCLDHMEYSCDLVPIKCQDSQIVRMHPLVLAALSPVLKTCLQDADSAEPVIVLPNVGAAEILDFFQLLLATSNEELEKLLPSWRNLNKIIDLCSLLGIEALPEVLNGLKINAFLDKDDNVAMMQQDHHEGTNDYEDLREFLVFNKVRKKNPDSRPGTELTKKENRTCPYCNKVYNHMRARNIHLVKKHKEECKADGKYYECDLCDDSFVTLYGKEKHLMRVHSAKGLSEVTTTSSNEQPPNSMMMTSVGQPKAPCPHCNSTFDDCQILRSHVKEIHPDKDLACLSCGLNLASKKDLFDHIQTHNGYDGSLFYSCPHCYMKFTVRYEMRIHIRRSHTASGPLYICDDCGSTYSNVDKLQDHVRVEHGLGADSGKRSSAEVRSFSCDDCGKKFRTRGPMERHMRSHNGLRPYPCPHCGKGFLEVAELKHHILTEHTEDGLRPFACTLCDKQFGLRSLLIKHMRSKEHLTHVQQQRDELIFTVDERDIETFDLDLMNNQDQPVTIQDVVMKSQCMQLI